MAMFSHLKGNAMADEQSEVKPGKPETENAKAISKEEALLRYIQERSFIFAFRKRYRPEEQPVLAKDLQTAIAKAERYAEHFDLRFISVRPMYLDLDKRREAE